MNKPSSKKIIKSILKDEGFVIAKPDVSILDEPISVEDIPKIHNIETDEIQKENLKIEKLQTEIKSLPKEEKKKTKLEIEKSKQQEETSVDEDIKTIVKYLNWHIDRISSFVIGRRDIIEQAFFGILTGEHLLMLSRTGMAKSYLTNYIFDSFEHVRIFATQASKDQTPDNYFGPYNIEEFKKGRIRHNLHGSIIEANFVFLDEFFDASDVVLRSLLSVLNERKFINGQEQVDCAIHSAIATANYMRMNEVTEAVLDRFLFRAIIPEDSNSFNKFLIDQSYLKTSGKLIEPKRRTPFARIKYLHRIIKNRDPEIKIIIPDVILYMKNIIIEKFVGEMRKHDYHFFISPRKQAKTINFLRASALLDGRLEVNESDLERLYLVVCTLNSYISTKSRDKTEKDIYLDIYNQTMNQFKIADAYVQIEGLLKIRHLFEEVVANPDMKEQIQQHSGLPGVLNFLKNIFSGKKSEEYTLQRLYQSVSDIRPANQEVDELKKGILLTYRTIL